MFNNMDILTNYMEDMEYIFLTLICSAAIAFIICGLLFYFKLKNDPMQHNCSKVSHRLSKSKSPNSQNHPFHFGISKFGNYRNFNISSGKTRNSRNSNKGKDPSNSNREVKDWLQNDMYCYERKFISSCNEDNMLSVHNRGHRNSTSSEAAGSDDLNSSSSNEDMCLTYLIQTNSSRKVSKSRQKKQQKRKQHLPKSNLDEESGEYTKLNESKQTSTKMAFNLRKQCTKAAALKTALNNSNISKSFIHSIENFESNSSVHGSLSSASSTTSINSSSSSPMNSLNSSPTASPTASKRNTEYFKKSSKSVISPLKQFTKLNMNEQELFQQMKRYIIDPSLLRVYGFPVESVHHEDLVEIYKCLPKHLAEESITKDNQRHHCHFYGPKKNGIINIYDGLYLSSCGQQSIDSGHGSDESSPRLTDSDSSEIGEDDSYVPLMAFYTPDGVYQIFSEYFNSVEKQCVRCSKMFQVDEGGKYMSFDSCTYHWGKLNNVYNGKCFINIYSCCQGDEFSEGCSQHDLHVWNGVVVGINGPYTNFLHTKHKTSKLHKHPKIYAIDCEMSYTGLGLEVTKVTVVGYDGSLVYEHFVRPQAEIIDYNTRFSGVSEKNFREDSNNYIKSFAEVQKDLINLFDADTILVGHGLDNDLRVLRLVHKNIVDTSVVFSHSTGYPYRRSLKNLTKSFLKRDIQCSDSGHSSFEDSRACLELMMWKIRKDLRHWNYP